MNLSLSSIWTKVVGVTAATEQEAAVIAHDIMAGVDVAETKVTSLFKYAANAAPAIAADVATLAPFAAAATGVAAAMLPGGEAIVVAKDIATVVASAQAASNALTDLQTVQTKAAASGQGAIVTDASSALALYGAVQSAQATVSQARAAAVTAVQTAKGAAS